MIQWFKNLWNAIKGSKTEPVVENKTSDVKVEKKEYKTSSYRPEQTPYYNSTVSKPYYNSNDNPRNTTSDNFTSGVITGVATAIILDELMDSNGAPTYTPNDIVETTIPSSTPYYEDEKIEERISEPVVSFASSYDDNNDGGSSYDSSSDY